MQNAVPEKVRLLQKLREGNFNVPPFVYVPAEHFRSKDFHALESFLKEYNAGFKVIARSAHPKEEFYKGGTFDSMETYADLEGIRYARERIVQNARTSKRLSILRQQKFSGAPEIDPEEMGVIVMPFMEGISVMAKVLGDHWEFGTCGDRVQKVQSEPYITRTPHDVKLLQLSEGIQKYLGFRCEIEFIYPGFGEIYVVQAKDISLVETLEEKEFQHSLKLDGVRRIRKRRSYRERPVYVMDNMALYIRIIGVCEDMILGGVEPAPAIDDILEIIFSYERELEDFAVRYERFGVIGYKIQVPAELFQIANHYLDELPEMQKKLSAALKKNMYKIDHFLSEADTLIAKDRIRLNLCSHDAYGIDTVRNPLWSVYWHADRHEQILKEFRRLHFTSGDTVGIDIDHEEKPTLYRL